MHPSTTPHLRSWSRAFALAAASLLTAACGSDGDGGDGTGQLNVRLTDAQGCGYKEVFVTVERVRIHSSDEAGEDEGGWSDLELSPARRVDLLKLRNGVFEDLGTLPLGTGTYHQVRLVLAENGNAEPFANQLTLEDDSVVALKTPSGQQSGLKLKVDVTIEEDELAELVLDFDPCKSVVKAGNSGKYNLKPVITAFANPTNDIEGFTLGGAIVSAQQDGESVKATTADADGRFLMWPVESGEYDLVITAPGRANAVLGGVIVETGRTVVSAEETPLIPAESAASRTAAGSVTLGGPDESGGVITARQVLTDGTVLEVAREPLEAPGGSFSFVLPTAAPGQATWAAGDTDYTFSDDAARAGLYSLRAAGAEGEAQTEEIDLNVIDAAVDFQLP